MAWKRNTAATLAVLLVSAFLPFAGSQALADCKPSMSLVEIADGDHRPAEHKARNKYRHPVETLRWFGVEPHMTVVEIWPGGKGWYTEILAPYLKDCGTFYAASFDENADIPYYRINAGKFKEKLAVRPDIYGKVQVTVLQPPKHLDIAPENSADHVLTFRNVHNWMKAGREDAIFAAMFRALKPGGVLGVVEHRGDPGKPQDPGAESGYVTEAYVIKLASRAGFEFVDKSEINANPKDTRDHPKGVWTLPPSLRLKDKDREHYLQIGESDRMTLKFLKPLASKESDNSDN